MVQELMVFRPHRTPPEQLEKTFVGREHLLQDILNKLETWQPGKSRQHYLIIGPRGIGKTNLLKLLEYRIEKHPPLNRKWYTVPFPEDAFGITRVTDLLVETLNILADWTKDEHIRDTYQKIRYDDDDQRVTDLALDAFRHFHRQKQCGILLMVENIDRVLEKQLKTNREIHLLRKILIEEDWLMLICTSPTYLNAVTKPERPLFEFFRVILLEELTADQQQEMLHKIARLEEDEKFIENDLDRLKPQLQALYHFTGGNPRLTLMLYDLIVKQKITEVKMGLDRLQDQLTPFYQDRMKDLGEQERKLLEKMALIAEGCTPTELAREVRMPDNHVRALLFRLEKTGYIRREERRQKQTVYIIPERFFRIWHQVNHSRAARGRVQYLLEFFASWYATPKDRSHIWDQLNREFQSVLKDKDEGRIEELTEYMHYIEDISPGEEKYQRLFDRLYQKYSRQGFSSIRTEIDNLDREYSHDGYFFLHKGIFLSNKLKQDERALSDFQAAERLMPDNIRVVFTLGQSLFFLRRYKEADLYFDQAIELLKKKTKIDNSNIPDFLLDILEQEEDPQIIRVCAYLLKYRYAEVHIIDWLMKIIRDTGSPFKKRLALTIFGYIGSSRLVPFLIDFLKDEANDVRGSAASALGQIGDKTAVSALIGALKDEANNVRGSAASALGLIGDELAVPYLLGCLSDEDRDVRISAVIALGKMAGHAPIDHLDQVIRALIDIDTPDISRKIVHAVRNLLDSAFASGDIPMIETAVKTAVTGIDDGEEVFKPYTVALAYLQADRNPGIITRQQPEMREAARLLLSRFDKSRKRA